MKILMVLDEEFPPDVRVEKEINILQGHGHDVDLLCYSRLGSAGFEKVKDINVFRVPISKIMYKFKALALLLPFYFSFWKNNLNHQIKAGNYDVIHFHDLNLAKVCYDIGRKFGIRVIGDYHENKPEIMKLYHHINSFPGNILISIKKWQNYQIKYSRLLDHIILVTEEAKDYYSKKYGISKNKITIIENFPDIDLLLSYPIDETIQRKYDKKRMIVYFGDTGIRRGTDTIIEAAKILRKRKAYHFVIIGTSREQQKLYELREKYGLGNVELTGEIPVEKAVSYFKAAKVGLCPFHRNIHHDTTYANKLFQYMAFGKPVLVSDCISQAKVVNQSECGLIHKAGDAFDLVEKLIKLENDTVYQNFADNAEKSVRNKYNSSFPEKKLINLYESFSNEIR